MEAWILHILSKLNEMKLNMQLHILFSLASKNTYMKTYCVSM